MAITTKTQLWKLAATKLGMAPSINILDANSPTTALELTFDQLYDNIRTAQLRSGKFDFAQRTRALRAAPTTDYSGNIHTWTENWDYVYSPPIGMLSFLHFADEPPGLGMKSDYEMLSLPIAYKRIEATIQVLYVISSSGSANYIPNYMWREWSECKFTDSSNVVHTITDQPDGATTDGFDWVSAAGTELPGAVAQTYLGGMAWSLDFQPGALSGEYDVTSAVAIAVDVAYGSPYQFENTQFWSEHIATQKANAEARYIVDVTEVSIMPVEFQNALATQLAYEASMVHAKSPRVISKLEIDAARMFSTAVSSLSSDDHSFEGGGPSRATRARY